MKAALHIVIDAVVGFAAGLVFLVALLIVAGGTT